MDFEVFFFHYDTGNFEFSHKYIFPSNLASFRDFLLVDFELCIVQKLRTGETLWQYCSEASASLCVMVRDDTSPCRWESASMRQEHKSMELTM